MDSSSTPHRTSSASLPQNLKPKSPRKSLARELLARRGTLIRRAALLFSVWLLATTPTNLMRLVYFVLVPPTSAAASSAALPSHVDAAPKGAEVEREPEAGVEGAGALGDAGAGAGAGAENSAGSAIYKPRVLWFTITLSFLTVVSVIELVLILGLWFILRQSLAAAASSSASADEEAATGSSNSTSNSTSATTSSAQLSLSYSNFRSLSQLPVCGVRPHCSSSCTRSWWREYGRIVLANALAATLACPLAFAAAHQIGFAAPFWRSRLSPLFWLALSAVVGILTPLLLLVPQRAIRMLTCRPLVHLLTCRALRRQLQEMREREPPKSLQRIE